MSVDQVIADWRSRGRELSASGTSSVVWEEGDGEPVLCFHGVPVCAFLYRKLLPELAGRGLRGVVFDLPGLGFADRSESFDYSWSGLANWSRAAVDELGLQRFHLVVHDIGGPVGIELARQLPERVASLTALNTIIRVAGFKRPWSMEPFARRGIGEAYLATMSGFAFQRLMRLQGVATDVPGEELRAYVKLLKRDDGGRAFLRIMRGFERTREFEDRIVAHLRERSYPAQVVWGERDPALRIERQGEECREALGVERIHRLAAKHFVPEDCPEQVAELVSAQATATG